MNPFIWLILELINIYKYVIIAVIVMSWLFQFNVINYSNPTVRQIYGALKSLTEPVLGPIRRIMPDLGGLDISPIIAFLGLEFLQRLIIAYLPNLL